VAYNSGILYVTVKSTPPGWQKKKAEVLFRWTHSQFYLVVQTTCHRFPNCHGNTSRMYVKWLWIYLSHMIAWLEDGCVYGNSKKRQKDSQNREEIHRSPSSCSQDSSNTTSASIAAPCIGSTSESGKWALVLQWVTSSSARATKTSTGATSLPGNHVNNSPGQDGAEVQLVARMQ